MESESYYNRHDQEPPNIILYIWAAILVITVIILIFQS